jgi:hypothetical protein
MIRARFLPVAALALGGAAALAALAGCSAKAPSPAAPVVTPPGQVSGAVWLSGAPLRGARVVLTPAGAPGRLAETDAQGYRFFDLAPGPVRVRLVVPAGAMLVAPDSAEKSHVVSAGANTIGPWFRLVPIPAPPGSLVVTVTLDNAPYAGASVHVVDATGGTRDGATDGVGRATFGGLAPGDASVGTVLPAPYQPIAPPGGVATVRVASDSVSALEFRWRDPSLPPLNDSPTHAVERLFESYGRQDVATCGDVLDGAFRYRFSAAADPDLVVLYGDSWTRDDELIAAAHVFDGYVDDTGVGRFGALAIDVQVGALFAFEDPDHPDSLDAYRAVGAAGATLNLTFPDGAGGTVETFLHGPFDVFVVRGDAAVLGPGQDPSPDRWYVRRIDDRAGPARAPGAAAATWGRLRANYRR